MEKGEGGKEHEVELGIIREASSEMEADEKR